MSVPRPGLTREEFKEWQGFCLLFSGGRSLKSDSECLRLLDDFKKDPSPFIAADGHWSDTQEYKENRTKLILAFHEKITS